MYTKTQFHEMHDPYCIECTTKSLDKDKDKDKKNERENYGRRNVQEMDFR